MEILNIHRVYFSATYTTKKVVRSVAESFKGNYADYDITQSLPETDILIGKDTLLIVGVPVYSGRVPLAATSALRRFKGDGTPAVIVCVYGNREYDDALLELKKIVQQNGFKVISAGAFIAQHSIFPAIGYGRPDEKDRAAIKTFADKSKEFLTSVTDTSALPDIKVKGNHPYKVPNSIPLRPKGDRKCNKCGICVELCPAKAIPPNAPRQTNKATCFSCGRCIVVCPKHARHFGGLLYKMAGKKFVKAFSVRKEPETILIS